MQLALKRRQQIREIPHYFGFSGRTKEMGTWGCRGDNAHLRHVTSRTISRCTDSAHEKSLNGRERKIEGKIERERGMEHTWPLRYSVVFQTLLWKNRGAGGQSITALACSYKCLLSVWAASMPPAVHTLREGRAGGQHRPLEGAPDHQSNQLLAWNQDSLPAYWWGRKGRSDPWCHWDRRPEKGKQFAHMVCLPFFFLLTI